MEEPRLKPGLRVPRAYSAGLSPVEAKGLSIPWLLDLLSREEDFWAEDF